MGVVVPEPYQYDRPIPRGQTAVQGYRVPDAPQLTNADAAATSQIASGFTNIGQELAKWSERLDVTLAQDAVNQLREARSDMTVGDNGFLKMRGGDVLKPGPDGEPIFKSYPQRFEQRASEIGGKLLSPRARQIYNERMSQELVAYKADVAKHGLTESEKYEASVYKNTQVRLQNDAAGAADDPKALETFAEQAYASTLARSKALGIEGEEMAKGARSDVYRIALESKIRSGDESAIGMFDRIKDKLDGKDVAAIEQSIKTLRTGSVARSQAGELLSGVPTTAGAEAGTKTSLQFWRGDGYTEKVSAGITAGFLRESQFYTGARNKGDGRDGSDSINIGQWNAARAQALLTFAKQNNLDPNDVGTGLKYAKAEIDGVIPYGVSGLSPDFKAKLQNAKTEKEAADIMTRGYFRPKYQDGESAHRQKSATQILEKYGTPSDPLATSVNQATGVEPPKNGPMYRDTRQMLLEADMAYDAATRRNMEVNAADEAQRRATQSQIDLTLATQKRQIEMAKLNLEISVDKWMTAGGPGGTSATQRPPPEIWNQLSYEKQRSIDSTIAHNAKGTDAITDQQTWYTIQQGLTSDDAAVRAEWASKPLWEYKAKLSNQDFQELAKMQATAKKGDPDKQLTHVRNINQLVDDTLLRMKVDTTPKPGSTDAEKAAKFRRSVQERVTEFEKDKGKKATAEEQQKIIDSLAIEVKGTGGWFSANKRRYDMKIDDVPAPERAKITDALKRAGVPASEEAIIDLFARKNAVPAR